MPIIFGGSGSGVGVTVSGAAVANNALIATSASAATWKFPPGYEIGYDQITAPVNIGSTTEATGTAIISCAAHTFDGGAVLAQFFAPAVLEDLGAAGDQVIISLFEAATQIGRLAVTNTESSTTQGRGPVSGFLRFTPSAAAHTYTITAFATSLTGTPSVLAGLGGTGVAVAAFARFTKV